MKLPFHYLSASITNQPPNDLGIRLDLSYITDQLIVCSYPTTVTVKKLYRNSINDLINYMAICHTSSYWEIWNLKAETQPSDSYEDFEYFPGSEITLKTRTHNEYMWVDHEAPPFHLLLDATDSLEEFLTRDPNNVAIVHCHMGKGRSGTLAVAYLMRHWNMTLESAMDLFTKERLKTTRFGGGVSILSQRKYLGYLKDYLTTWPRIPYPMDSAKAEQVMIDAVRLKNFAKISDSDLKCLHILIGCYSSSNKELIPKISISSNQLQYQNEDIHSFLLPTEVIPLDFRVQVCLTSNSSTQKSSKSTPLVLRSNSYTWINAYFEALHYKNLATKQTTVKLPWEELDGWSGSSHFRGTKLFDVMEIDLHWVI